ncbi:MAG: chorismate synthase [Deltaproteobacteria bacterium]|nr:chorismate synthase [Deltaproteobacteria bacterium]
MSFNSFGTLFKVTTFGESHGPLIGAVVDGVPSGIELSEEKIQGDMDRRRPGTSNVSSGRNERDLVEIVSGVFRGRTTGAPVAVLVRNQGAQPSDYEQIKNVFRPGHADWTWEKKFGFRDWRGGGRSSGRETVARVAAGAIARLVLASRKIEVAGCIKEIGGIVAALPGIKEEWTKIHALTFPCPDPVASKKMKKAIKETAAKGDSLGGIVEVRAFGVQPGLGEPVFDKLDARLGAALFSIGAVKGVEIGDGFDLARKTGASSNDQLEAPGRFKTNHSGGILGGISNGDVIVVRTAVKPTPSISKTQDTVDSDGKKVELSVKGRHDPCIVPRLVPVAEAMVCLVLADFIMLQEARKLETGMAPNRNVG